MAILFLYVPYLVLISRFCFCMYALLSADMAVLFCIYGLLSADMALLFYIYALLSADIAVLFFMCLTKC